MSDLERDFGRAFAKAMRAGGAEVYPLIAGRNSPVGWPDKLVWSRRWGGLVELKGPATKVDPIQVLQLQRLHVQRPGTAVLYRRHPTLKDGGTVHWAPPGVAVERLLAEGLPLTKLLEGQPDWDQRKPIHVEGLLDYLRSWQAQCQFVGEQRSP